MPRPADPSTHFRGTLVSPRFSPFFSFLCPLRLCALCVNSFSSFFLLCALAALLLVGCYPSVPADPAAFTFLIESSPTNLDPRFATDSQSQRFDGLLFSSLLERDDHLNLHGDLAESWEAPDPSSMAQRCGLRPSPLARPAQSLPIRRLQFSRHAACRWELAIARRDSAST
jgi:hypothetical protein